LFSQTFPFDLHITYREENGNVRYSSMQVMQDCITISKKPSSNKIEEGLISYDHSSSYLPDINSSVGFGTGKSNVDAFRLLDFIGPIPSVALDKRCYFEIRYNYTALEWNVNY